MDAAGGSRPSAVRAPAAPPPARPSAPPGCRSRSSTNIARVSCSSCWAVSRGPSRAASWRLSLNASSRRPCAGRYTFTGDERRGCPRPRPRRGWRAGAGRTRRTAQTVWPGFGSWGTGPRLPQASPAAPTPRRSLRRRSRSGTAACRRPGESRTKSTQADRWSGPSQPGSGGRYSFSFLRPASTHSPQFRQVYAGSSRLEQCGQVSPAPGVTQPNGGSRLASGPVHAGFKQTLIPVVGRTNRCRRWGTSG